MGGSDVIKDVTAGTVGFLTGGPVGAATATAASRKKRGKDVVGKDITRLTKPPEFPDSTLPEEPETDPAQDALLRQALVDRIRRDSIRGGGQQATIKTGPLGVTERAPVIRKILTGV